MQAKPKRKSTKKSVPSAGGKKSALNSSAKKTSSTKRTAARTSRSTNPPRPMAMFDLDHTLLPYDTMLLLCNYVIKQQPWRLYYLLFIIPLIPGALLGWIRSKTLKRFFFSFLAGKRQEQLATLVEEFVHRDVLPRIHPELLSEIAQHRQAGRMLILNTASPTLYAGVIGKALGFERVYATPMQLDQPMALVPAINGKNNKGTAKLEPMEADGLMNGAVQAARQQMEKTPREEWSRHIVPVLPGSYAYSDSPADLPMLLIAEHSMAINPRSSFYRQIAVERNWRILDSGDPHRSALAYQIARLRQLLGIYPAGRS